MKASVKHYLVLPILAIALGAMVLAVFANLHRRHKQIELMKALTSRVASLSQQVLQDNPAVDGGSLTTEIWRRPELNRDFNCSMRQTSKSHPRAAIELLRDNSKEVHEKGSFIAWLVSLNGSPNFDYAIGFAPWDSFARISSEEVNALKIARNYQVLGKLYFYDKE